MGLFISLILKNRYKSLIIKLLDVINLASAEVVSERIIIKIVDGK